LHMQARYKATHYPVAGGKANGQVWFSLTYL
ncbi:fimbrial protein, partial [Escherichia coli]